MGSDKPVVRAAGSPLFPALGQDPARQPGSSPEPPSACVVFVQTVDQIQSLAECRAATPSLCAAQVVGLASHLSLGQAASRAGLELRPHTDYVTGAGFVQAAKEAGEVFRDCFQDLLDDRPAAEAMEALRLEILQELNEILLAQLVVSRALHDLAPATLLLPETLDGKVAAVARYEAGQRQIEVRSLGAPQPAAAPRRNRLELVVRQLAAPLARNIPTLVAHAWKQARARRPVLLSFGSGVDSVNQQRLMPALEAAGAVRPVLVRTREVDASAFNRPGGSRYPTFYFVALRAMLRSRRYASQGRRGLAAFYRRLQARPGEAPALLASPWLRPYVERIFLYRLPHVLATQRDARTLLDTFRPRLVLTSCEVSFPARVLVSEAKKRRIPTLGLLHSGLSNMLYRDFGSDRMAVWGDVHVRDFCRVLGKQPSQLFPLGNPQYDVPLCGSSQAQTRSSSATPRVLVVTALSQWQMFHFDLRQHERAWRELERLPESGVQVMIKPHPRFDDYAFYRSLRRQLSDWRSAQPGISLIEGAFLEEVLPACDLVVVPNFPTTGAVEAMLCRKPVVYLMCGTAELPFFTSVAPGCLVVREIARICPAILEVLGSPERQSAIVEQGQAYLDQLLGSRDGQATRRLSQLAGEMVAAPGEIR